MRPCEADWLFAELAALGPAAASPVLNLGSADAAYRRVKKPHIEARLFGPLRAAGYAVVHADLKAGDGVHLTGDILDPAFVAALAARGFRTIICSNMLEHVRDPAGVARACATILGDGGRLLVTVPFSYPYHADPLDNFYRPSPAELAALFPRAQVRASLVLDDGTLWDEEAGKGVPSLLRYGVGAGWRIASGLWRPRIALAQLHRLTWLFRPFKVSAVSLELPAAAGASPEPERAEGIGQAADQPRAGRVP